MLEYSKIEKNNCCPVYDHTLKIRPDILKMAAILGFFQFCGWGTWSSNSTH